MNTDYKNIDQLLNKYFEGLTSLEEETVLQNYFASDQVDAAHAPYKALFLYFKQAQQTGNPQNISIPQPKSNRRFYYAASVALFLGLGLVWLLQQNHKGGINPNDTASHIQVNNPNPAKQKEAKKEIKKFTRNVSEGLDKTATLSIFGQTTQKVFNLKKTKK